MSSTFQILQGEIMHRCKVEDGSYKHCKRKNSENYFNKEEPQMTLAWKSILGRKFKGGVVEIIIRLGAEVAPLIEIIEQKNCNRTQELLNARKVIVACDASVKMARWENAGL